jgi:hypothetical protein
VKRAAAVTSLRDAPPPVRGVAPNPGRVRQTTHRRRLVPLLRRHRFVECRMQVVQCPGHCTIQLAGRLDAAQVSELRGICAHAMGALQIDLTDLLAADAVGLDALRRLRDEGAELVGVAHYLQQWLA